MMITDTAYPVEPWQIRETQLDLNLLAQSESLFALSNGHIGLRGNLDEGEPYGLPGTYLGSFFEVRPLPYAEAGFGYPEAGQTVVDVTNGKILRLLVDDEPFDVRYGELIGHERTLDLRAGTLSRHAHWRSPAGKQVRIESIRLVSLVQRGVAAIEYTVEAVDEFVRVTVQSELVTNEDQPETSDDPRVSAALREPLQAVHHEHTDGGALLIHRTHGSALMMAAAMEHDIEVPGRVEVSTDARPDLARTTVICGLRPGQKLRIVKYLGMGGRVCGPGRHCAIRSPARSPGPGTAAGRACWTPNAATSTTSGTAPTSRSRVTRIASRRCASGSSMCCRPARGPSGARSRARD